MTKDFDKLYGGLNPEQRRAVDTVEGPVMVIAGPGTGKTTILILRIANILRVTDADPDSILALTFTDAAAQEMRSRLVGLMGSSAYRVSISTFHGFCNSQIQDNPEDFPRIIGSRPITDTERIKLIESLIKNEKLEVLRPLGSPFFHMRAILSAVTELKKESITVEEFKRRIASERSAFDENTDKVHVSGLYEGKMKGVYKQQERLLKKNEELSVIYQRYQEELQKRQLYDFDDMIIEVIQALEKNKDFKLTLQEQYQYLLADEHQDANGAQNRLLELLSDFHDNPNLFIVGDDKQAIFRFQGASLENFLFFKNKYPSAEQIVLKTNYRSTQTILDASADLIEKGEIASLSSADLKSVKKGLSEPITIFECSNKDVEQAVVVTSIEKHITNGVDFSEIAVLVRDNKDAFGVIEALKRADLPFVLESKQDILSDNEIQKLITLFTAIDSFGDDEIWTRSALIGFIGIDPLDVHRIGEFARRKKQPIYDVISSETKLSQLNLSTKDAVNCYYKNLSSWKTLSAEKPMIEVFERVIEESGFLSYVLGLSSVSAHLARLQGIFDEVKRLSGAHPRFMLEDFMEYLRVLKDHGIVVKKRVGGSSRQGVRILTAHGAKGREFDVVIVVGVVDGHWGNRRRRKTFYLPLQGSADVSLTSQDNDDERRLLYVALTRARYWAGVTYSLVSVDGHNAVPSQFLSEISPDLLQVGSVEVAEKAVAKWQRREKTNEKKQDTGKEWVSDLFVQQGLSVTALNNFLECPWKYFFMNLVRVPKAPAPHQLFGIAIHAALRLFFDTMRDAGKDPGKDYLIERFRERLSREWLDEKTIDEWMARGEKSFAGYYDKYVGSWPTAVITEFYVGGVEITTDVRLKGRLDKLEILDSGDSVNVVDYKTGKPKSRNVIEGNTKNSDGTIKRQLIFYKILLDGDDSKYKLASGEIDFIEPNTSGKYKKEKFEITDADVVDLETIIKDVAKQIMTVSFWNEQCDDRECEYCQLRGMMAS